MSLLEDLVASHKALCQAVLQSAASGADSGLSSSQSRNEKPAHVPQASADSPFLTEDEDDRFSKEMGLEPNPLMDKIIDRQYLEMFEQRQARAADPSTPKPMSPQTRPRMITPDFKAPPPPRPMFSEAESELTYEEEPLPQEEAEDIPDEIKFMDALTTEKLKAPEPMGRSPRRIMPRDVLDDFQQRLGG